MLPQQVSNALIPAGLQPNETYTFAVAAYDAEHKLISDLGQSVGPVAALLPMPLLHLWCHLALIAAHLGVANITHLAAGVVLPHFVTTEPDCPVWEANPLDRQTVIRSVLRLHISDNLQDKAIPVRLCVQMTNAHQAASQLTPENTLMHLSISCMARVARMVPLSICG